MDDDRRQRNLLTWYDRLGRKLPWRDHRDPYAVLVSEFMLQQTQAARVTDHFERFLRRFPDVGVLSAAGPGAVIHQWRGLGYNRRAVALHRTAEQIVTQHGGEVPTEVADLQMLPGVGPYTARAIAAFAFGRPAAPVDVNIARVLSRAVAGRPLGPAAAQAAADGQIASPRPAAERPGDWSQALMDLGVAHCRKRLPVCAACPILADCAWQRGAAGRPLPSDPAARRTDSPTGDGRARRARFNGSDRQHRGLLLDAVRGSPVPRTAIADASGLEDDPERAARLARDLAGDGLVRYCGDELRLP